MPDLTPDRPVTYDVESRKKSKRLLYLLVALGVLIVAVFGGLHLWGQSIGVQV